MNYLKLLVFFTFYRELSQVIKDKEELEVEVSLSQLHLQNLLSVINHLTNSADQLINQRKDMEKVKILSIINF